MKSDFKCIVKMRGWDEKLGLVQKSIEAVDIEDLFHDLVDSPDRDKVHSIILQGPDREGHFCRLTLEVSTLVKD